MELVATDFIRPRVDASFYVKNLTNVTYAQTRSSALSSFGYASTAFGDPMTFGFTLSYRFGG